jgi:hypothetical protein
MSERWAEFYLMAGSAAAVLIGLIFVVVTLMQDRSRSSVLYGSRLYMGPIVLHMSFVVVLSAAALAPGIDAHSFAIIAGVIAVWGAMRGIYSIAGIQRLRRGGEDEVHWTDTWYYGAIPLVLYMLLARVALGFWHGWVWAEQGLAIVVIGLILLAIRDEYDLVTWLAPRADSTEHEFGAEQKKD